MSSNSNSSNSSPPRIPPHIRLNSGQSDLLASDSASHGNPRSILPARPSTAPRLPHAQKTIYADAKVQDSAEHLLPPARSRSQRYRDESADQRSPARSTYSSRRTSWSSEHSRDSRGYENPFADSRGPSRAESRGDSDEENVNTQTVSEKYNILPSAGLLLFPEDVEKDDYLHNPDGKEPKDCDIFTRRGFVNVGGLALITLGILVIFIGYPAL